MKVITIDGVGEVTLKKSAKAKRLILKLSAEGVPTVTVPTYVPYIVAHKFVLRQAQWIKEHARTMRPSIITNDKRVGFDHYVVFAPTEKDKPSSRVSATKITVLVPRTTLRTHPAVQAEAKKACIRALRKQAEVYLPKKIHSFMAITTRILQSAPSKRDGEVALVQKTLTSASGSCNFPKYSLNTCFVMN